MDEAMKRRLVGVLVIVAVVFIISLLLPHPGTIRTENNQRVTLDLTGKEPETVHVAATPVPPVIAAAPATKETTPVNTPPNDSAPPQIEEPPIVTNNLPAESMTDDNPLPPKPKPETVVAATTPGKPAPAKPETKPAATPAAKPAEKVPAKIAAKPAAPVAKPVAPAPKPAATTTAKARWFVQVGAFSDVANAHQTLDKLNAKGLKGLISPLDSDKGTRYRARIGPFATRDLAKQAQDKAAKLGYASSSVIED